MAELARVLYGDPPWHFITRSVKGKGRSSEAWYDCLSLAELQALPVAQMAAPDSFWRAVEAFLGNRYGYQPSLALVQV